jgi:hypothetical protein
LLRLFFDNAKKLTGQPKNAAYQAFDRKQSQRTAPQNLGHEILPTSFFQVVIFIHSFLYLVSLHWQTLLFVSARIGHVSCMANKYHYIRGQGCKNLGATSKFLTP